jgi:hypothetical protein
VGLLIEQDKDILKLHSNDDTTLEDINQERQLRKMNSLDNYWRQPHRAQNIDESLATLCFSIATDATLDGNLGEAQAFFQVGIFLRTWIRLGTSVVLQILSLFEVDGSNEHMIRFFNVLYQTRTDRGLTLFLGKRMPCTCLEGKVSSAKDCPKTDKCNGCKEQSESSRLMKCMQCLSIEYCSKECQRADWKSHKQYCALLKKGTR